MKNTILPADVFRSDAVERADVGIVLGSSDPELLQHRISAAVVLFKAKRVRTLLLSGDGRSKNPEGRTEADRMREIAVKAGVPETAIVMEDASKDPISTAKECTRLLKSHQQLQGTKSAIVVTSAWHTLRTFIILRKHLPHSITLSCFPAAEGCTAKNWQTTPQNRAIVTNELRLIETLLKTGYSLR